MLPILVIAVAIGLIVLGIKGFTASGIPLTKTVSLNGKQGKIVGAICIFAGVVFVPAFFLFFLLVMNLSR